MKFKFGQRVVDPIALRPGFGKALSECKTLHEVSEFMRLAERAVTEGKIDGMNARCPHCHRRFSVNLIDGLIMVPNAADDPISTPARQVYCPHAATGCGREFKLDPKPGWHWEIWP
jgi:hypothetical protein